MKKEIVYDCPVVISSVIIRERKFAKYRKVAKKAAEDLGYKVHLNNEDDASNQSGFNEILNTKNPIVIALFGKIKSKTVIEECKLALKNNLHIIPLYKKYSQKANADNITKEYICEISLPMYNNDCHHFIDCKDLYKHVKQALINYQKELLTPQYLSNGHSSIYNKALKLLRINRRNFILCQKTSTLILGAKAGRDGENDFYHSLQNWILNKGNSLSSDKNMKFKHIFSLEATKKAIQSDKNYDIKSAKDNLKNLLSQNYDIKFELIDIDWQNNYMPFVISDGNVLSNLFFANMEFNVIMRRHTIQSDYLKFISDEIISNGKVIYKKGIDIDKFIEEIFGENKC